MDQCIVISDSFKGTLSSREICRIAREVVPEIFPHCRLITIPVADGGEGTVDCFLEALGADPVAATVQGPHGEPLRAIYARKGDRAIVEMASAAGLPLVGERLDPEGATTYGVGQLIRHAVEGGCREVLLGLGGSATHDGGCGCAAALGVKFFDITGGTFVPVGGTLDRIARIDRSGAEALLRDVKLTAMCDVDNPLCGPAGAARVFAPQKGADGAMVDRLDRGLAHLAGVIRRDLGLDVADLPGAGAAGGMGGGCVALLGAQLKSGIEGVLDMVDFDRHLEGTDLVITGEGRLDGQSLRGKVISGIANRTRPRNIPLVALVGAIHPDSVGAYQLGVTAMFSINREAKDFRACAHQTGEYYRRTLEDVLRLIRGLERGGTAP